MNVKVVASKSQPNPSPHNTKEVPITTATTLTTKATFLSVVAFDIYPSPGPNIPPAPVAPGTGAPFAPPPPPSTFVGAVGKLLGVVVEEVAFPVMVLFPERVTFPDTVMLPETVMLPPAGAVARGAGVMVCTIVWTTVVGFLFGPSDSKVEKEVDKMSDTDCEGDGVGCYNGNKYGRRQDEETRYLSRCQQRECKNTKEGQ